MRAAAVSLGHVNRGDKSVYGRDARSRGDARKKRFRVYASGLVPLRRAVVALDPAWYARRMRLERKAILVGVWLSTACAPVVLTVGCSSSGTSGTPSVDGGTAPEAGSATATGSTTTTPTGTSTGTVPPGTATAGRLDPSFGAGGKSPGVVPASFDFTPTTGLVMKDDSVIVVGFGSDSIGTSDTVLGRFRADGSPDLPQGGNASIKLVTNPTREKVVGVRENTARQLVLYGVNDTPNAISSFFQIASPIDGKCTGFFLPNYCSSTPNSTTPDVAPVALAAVVQNTSGETYAGGAGPYVGLSDFMLVKLAADGSVATTFGTPGGNGTVRVDFGGTEEGISLLDLRSDGKILAIGGSNNASKPGVVMARFTETGALDETFGTAGKAFLGVPSQRLARTPDGKFVGAYAEGSGSAKKTRVVRMLADGTLDTTFGTSGKAEAPWPNGAGALTALLAHPDGSLLVGYDDFTVGRLTAAGSSDPTWNDTGFHTVTFPTSVTLTALGVQSDGRVVAMGGASKVGNDDKAAMFVVRFTK